MRYNEGQWQYHWRAFVAIGCFMLMWVFVALHFIVFSMSALFSSAMFSLWWAWRLGEDRHQRWLKNQQKEE